MSSPTQVASDWLDCFSAALVSKDTRAVSELFLSDGWLRDILVFTWKIRSLEGTDKIVSYLSASLPSVDITAVKLSDDPYLKPSPFTLGHYSGVEVAFTFQTPIGLSRGHARLVLCKLSGAWKALSVLMMLDQLREHPEISPSSTLSERHNIPWSEVERNSRERIEADPYVVIVGAGQTGLQVAARLKAVDIPSLVIDQDSRIGDNWRRRYDTLSLQTCREHHAMLYAPFPTNWPMYSPRDKIADWIEQYAANQDLVVWTESSIIPTPVYDEKDKSWSIRIKRLMNGNEMTVTLRPAHLVIATGITGPPLVPVSSAHFDGVAVHGSQYKSGKAYTGKRVVVVGAGNTAGDICHDLSVHGAQSVTMIQRSSTCVISSETIRESFRRAWPEGISTEVLDYKAAAMPIGLARKMPFVLHERDQILHEKLMKKGFHINDGPDGAGLQVLVAERFGGHLIDVGFADLLASGKVFVKQGVEVGTLRDHSVIFSDGSKIEADAVIFATGFKGMGETLKELFSPSVTARIKHSNVWGLDEEGEMIGLHRPSGHPGLWFAGGGFQHSRFGSKLLALHIKAVHVGLIGG